MRRYSLTKLCDGAQMSHFWQFLGPAFPASRACSTFQTCILNSHEGHTMCGSTVNIQSPTAEIRRGKKERRRKEETTGQNTMVCPIPYGDHRKTKATFSRLASYGIWPGNGEGLFWFRSFINLLLTYSLTPPPPGRTRWLTKYCRYTSE